MSSKSNRAARWGTHTGYARPRDPQYSFDKAAIVAATASRVRRLAQTMRFHLRPLGVRQNKTIHSKRESHFTRYGNPKSQQALDEIDAHLFPAELVARFN